MCMSKCSQSCYKLHHVSSNMSKHGSLILLSLNKCSFHSLILNLHFSTGSGASTYTLDSGIGTFPLPDCSSGPTGRGPSKTRAEHHSADSPGRAGRRARTLDRELPSQEEGFGPHKQLIPSIQYCSVLEGRSSAAVIHEGIIIQTVPS